MKSHKFARICAVANFNLDLPHSFIQTAQELIYSWVFWHADSDPCSGDGSIGHRNGKC